MGTKRVRLGISHAVLIGLLIANKTGVSARGGIFNLDGTDAGDSITLRLAENQTDLLVFLNSETPTVVPDVSFLDGIVVDGRDGNDTIVIDVSNGDFTA